MVSDVQFLSDNESTGSSDSIVISINKQFQCNHCIRTFNTELELSKHKNQLSTRTGINVVKRVMMKNQNENNTRLPTFIPPPTSQSQRSFYQNRSPPSPPSHTLLFTVHGSGGYNHRFHPYMRPIREVSTFPPPREDNKIGESSGRTMDLISLIDKHVDHHDKKIDESLGRTTDLISLIDKHVDSVGFNGRTALWDRGYFEAGSSSNNTTNKYDIGHILKL
jgi:hypothetical protein